MALIHKHQLGAARVSRLRIRCVSEVRT